jgi:hypothetical protein
LLDDGCFFSASGVYVCFLRVLWAQAVSRLAIVLVAVMTVTTYQSAYCSSSFGNAAGGFVIMALLEVGTSGIQSGVGLWVG